MVVITQQDAAERLSPVFKGRRGKLLFDLACRITGIAKCDKVRALYDTAVLNVQTRNDSFTEHLPPSFLCYNYFLVCFAQRFRIASPASPLFSGWNWQAKTLSLLTLQQYSIP